AGDRTARVRGDPGARLPGRDRPQLHRRPPHRRRHAPLGRPLHAGRPPDPAMSQAARGESPGRVVWRALRRNRPAVVGLTVVVAFFLLALIGLALTKGAHPILDSREVRLPDRLQGPFARPNRESVPAASWPRLGIYLFGTDELGRDVFARMLEGAFVSLSVGFVAVGLAVLIGIALGGVAGYYGPLPLRLLPLRPLTVHPPIPAPL